MKCLFRLLKDESGTAVIEYSLIGTLISIVAIVAMSAVGTTMSSFYFANVAGAFR